MVVGERAGVETVGGTGGQGRDQRAKKGWAMAGAKIERLGCGQDEG